MSGMHFFKGLSSAVAVRGASAAIHCEHSVSIQGSELLPEPNHPDRTRTRYAGGAAVRQSRLHSKTAAGPMLTATVWSVPLRTLLWAAGEPQSGAQSWLCCFFLEAGQWVVPVLPESAQPAVVSRQWPWAPACAPQQCMGSYLLTCARAAEDSSENLPLVKCCSKCCPYLLLAKTLCYYDSIWYKVIPACLVRVAALHLSPQQHWIHHVCRNRKASFNQ